MTIGVAGHLLNVLHVVSVLPAARTDGPFPHCLPPPLPIFLPFPLSLPLSGPCLLGAFLLSGTEVLSISCGLLVSPLRRLAGDFLPAMYIDESFVVFE